MKVIIDGKHIKSEEDFHSVLARELDFPDFYGQNLDALWDCMTGFVSMPLHLTWANYSVSEKKMSDSLKAIIELFNNLVKEKVGFSYELIG